MLRLNRHFRRKLARIGLAALMASLSPSVVRAGNLTGVTIGADRTSSLTNPFLCVGGGNPNACQTPLGTFPSAGGPFVFQGDGSSLNLTVGGVTKSFPAWWGTIGQPGGPASLGADGKVAAAQIVNRSTVSPSVASIGTTAATVFPAGTYVSVRIRMTCPGQQMAATGDGTAPVLGTSTTATAPGQDIFWPVQAGGAMPSGPFQAVATGTCTIAAEAH